VQRVSKQKQTVFFYMNQEELPPLSDAEDARLRAIASDITKRLLHSPQDVTPENAVVLSMITTEQYAKEFNAALKHNIVPSEGQKSPLPPPLKNQSKKKLALQIFKYVVPVVVASFFPSTPVVLITAVGVEMVAMLIERFMETAKNPELVDVVASSSGEEENQKKTPKKGWRRLFCCCCC
jgi:hypothetical protein